MNISGLSEFRTRISAGMMNVFACSLFPPSLYMAPVAQRIEPQPAKLVVSSSSLDGGVQWMILTPPPDVL